MEVNKKMLGGWAIDVECYEYIRNILPTGKTILEFGSGSGSNELSKYYTLYSIEHDPKWVDKYNTNYIYVPLSPIIIGESYINWYNKEKLKKQLPEEYDLILVDGPPEGVSPNRNSRQGLYYNLELFNFNNTIIIFDDVQRKMDMLNLINIAKVLNKNYKIFDSGFYSQKNKKFGVIGYDIKWNNM